MKKNHLLYILLLLLTASCYEDKGNYTYDESIYDISVKVKDVYGIRKSDEKMTYTITPEIKTHDGDKSSLRYTWLINTQGPTFYGDTISRDSTVSIPLDPEDPNFAYKYYLRLYVTDLKTQGETMVATELDISQPYSKAWAVLHETDGHAELGTVEYVGNDMLVTPDAYTKEAGKSLTGKPLALTCRQHASDAYSFGYESLSQLYVSTTNDEESGLFNQVDHFKLMAPWSKLFNQSQLSNVQLTGLKGEASTNGGVIINTKGHLFRNSYYSPYFYEMKPSTTFLGDYGISRSIAGPHTALGFDSIGHRFVHINLQSGDTWTGYNPTGVKDAGNIEPIQRNSGDGTDPSKIASDIQIINFVNGYHYEVTGTAIWQKYSAYAYGLGNGNRSYVYVFRYYALTHTDVASMPGYFSFVTPEGVTASTPMASGYKYNNILFYAVDNKVYKLDFSTGQSSLIYQNEDPSAKISCLKMAVDGYSEFATDEDDGTQSYGHPYCQCLGVGVNTSDGKGELVVLQLNSAGKVDTDHKYPSIQTHKGFGKIKDIAFM